MTLAPMKYKDFTWPHNPERYTIEYERVIGNRKVPFGTYHLQDMGLTCRVMRGEGVFVGEDAYDRFKALATVFYSGGAGVLIHPVWQTANAYFTELELCQEPRRDYVRYRFTFWESFDGYEEQLGLQEVTEEDGGSGTIETEGGGAALGNGGGATVHRVRKGESLWGIARSYGTTVEGLLALNPSIKNPALIYPEQEVRVK